ncbi:MAG TPA: hypothetical protein VMT46_16010 [Anaerolineaceae bacterium]|nr:hypothetical protein [Anaerolineaceae bacterium]
MKKRRIKMVIVAFLIVWLAMDVTIPYPAYATPLSVTVHGQITFEPRNWNTSHTMLAGKEMEIDLYEKDHTGAIFFIASTYTNSNGNFSFSVTNYWGPFDPHLNIFYRVKLNYPSTVVYNPPNLTDPYSYDSSPTLLNSDTITDWTKDFAIGHTLPNYQAVWIFEDMRNSWNYVYSNDIRNGVHYNPGGVTAYWTLNSNCYQDSARFRVCWRSHAGAAKAMNGEDSARFRVCWRSRKPGFWE